MPTENGRETEDSFDFSNMLLNTLGELSSAAYQGANTTYTYCNKQFHALCDYAEYLDKKKHVYWLYGGPDGFVLAFSLLKYIPDLIYNGSKTETAKALRDFICNPWGSAITVTWLAALTLTSAYANGMSRDKDNKDAQARYVSWQAFRDGVKGARNTNRGLRHLMDTVKLFSSIDMRYTLLPLSLLLGIPSMYNRWWNRHMVTIRKKTMDKNQALSEERLAWGRFDQSLTHLPASEEELKRNHANSYLLINKHDLEKRKLFYINRNGEAEDLKLTPDELTAFLDRKHKLQRIDKKHPSLLQWQAILPTHTDRHFHEFNNQLSLELNQNIDQENTNHAHNNRFTCYLSAGFDGLTSGLYLFMGLVLLVPLPPAILTTAAIMSTLCVVACIFTRMQEETEYDRLLRISEKKAILISEVQTYQTQLATAAHLGSRQPRDATGVIQTDKDIEAKNAFDRAEKVADETYERIRDAYKEFQTISSISPVQAFFIGLKHGLVTHGTIVTGIFAASLISKVFFATMLSQAFVIGCIIISCAMIVASIIAVVSDAAQHRKKQATDYDAQLQAVDNIINNIKNYHDTQGLTAIENESAFAELCRGTPLTKWTFINWLEVFRSTGSGTMKGPKSVDFILLTFFDASNYHDHKNDHPLLALGLGIALVLCAIIWTFRALAKFAKDLRDNSGITPSPAAENTGEQHLNIAYESGSELGSDTEDSDERPSPLRHNHDPDNYQTYPDLPDSPERHDNHQDKTLSLPPSTRDNPSFSGVRKAASYDSTLKSVGTNSNNFFNLDFGLSRSSSVQNVPCDSPEPVSSP